MTKQREKQTTTKKKMKKKLTARKLNNNNNGNDKNKQNKIKIAKINIVQWLRDYDGEQVNAHFGQIEMKRGTQYVLQQQYIH